MSGDPEAIEFICIFWIPFDFAQSGEPVEPRILTTRGGLLRSKIPTSSAGNDGLQVIGHSVEGQKSFMANA
jgi:hypothetical protein